MAHQLTIEDARQSLAAHVADRGAEIRERFGPRIGMEELQRIMEDRTCVRYPCALRFGAQPLQPGELAYPQPRGETPEAGFTIVVHPRLAADPAACVAAVLYQLVVVNYGEFAGPEDAESFGAAVLGCPREEYYTALCGWADSLAAGDAKAG